MDMIEFKELYDQLNDYPVKRFWFQFEEGRDMEIAHIRIQTYWDEWIIHDFISPPSKRVPYSELIEEVINYKGLVFNNSEYINIMEVPTI